MTSSKEDYQNDCRRNKYELWLENQGKSKVIIEAILEADPTGKFDENYEDYRES